MALHLSILRDFDEPQERFLSLATIAGKFSLDEKSES